MERLSVIAKLALSSRSVSRGDAVMFDIDDTLWEPMTNARIQPMIELLYTARMLGYTIIVITARPGTPTNREWTISQLHGMLGVVPDHLMFCAPEHKSAVKAELERAGRARFIMSVGDQWTDLGSTKWWLKLPAYNDPRMGGNFYRLG